MLHTEFTPHAFITLSNFGGIEIMLNRSNDGVYYRFNYGQNDLDNEEIFESEIQYTTIGEESEAYFEHSTHTDGVYACTNYFLNEAMRIK